MKRFLAELTGTFGLVFIGCGTAVFSQPWAGYVGISCAFGFTLTALMTVFGNVSGAHFNPAVTLGVAVSGTFDAPTKTRAVLRFLAYLCAQTAGAFAASALLYSLYFSKIGLAHSGTFGANICTRYPATTAFVLETLLTALFVGVFLKTTTDEKTKGFAPLASGLMLTAVSILAMPVTFAGFNPAKSASQVLFGGEGALAQLPLFIAAPLTGGLIAGLCFRLFKAQKA